jgi:hypothetical protein
MTATLLIGLYFVASSAFAQSPYSDPGSPRELVNRAQIICTATVASVQCQWKTDHRGRHIYSDLKLTVDRWLEGLNPGTTVNLEVVGGTAGGIVEVVSNMPVFVAGEQVLLFLAGSPLQVVGGHMGKLAIHHGTVCWNGREMSIDELLGRTVRTEFHTLGEASDVSAQDELQGAPKITDVIPDTASAGTGSEIIILGSGFGEDPDEGMVEFSHETVSFGTWDDFTKIRAPIISWADDMIVCTVPVDANSRSAGSGPVAVTTAARTSNRVHFTVTFSYGGNKWQGASPIVEYYVNENCADCEDEFEAIHAAAEIWNNTGAALCLQYAGPTTSTEPNCNNRSELLWGPTINNFPAVTYRVFRKSDGFLLECDTVFNSDDPNWSWSTQRTSNPNAGYEEYDQMDVQTIALHELGHWLRLLDLYGYDTGKAMYGYTEPKARSCTGASCKRPYELKRDLHPYDVAGIHYIYPPLTPPSAPTQIEYPAFGSDGQFTVIWGTSAQASSYELERSNDAGVTWLQVYTGPSTRLEEVVDPGKYRYRIRAMNSVGPSEWLIGTWNCTSYAGDADDPILIHTADELISVGARENLWDKHFTLMADLDLDPNLPGGRTFDKAIIAWDRNDATQSFEGTLFTGVFDGNGHVISNMTIEGKGYLGMFGNLASEAEVKELGVKNVRIVGSGRYVGALGAYCWGTTIDRCYSSGLVKGASYVGGLVGYGSRGVTNCYSTGTVNGTSAVGGLIGFGIAAHCYSACRVSGSDPGGLIGRWKGSPEGGVSFWDTDIGPKSSAGGAIGKTTAEMKTRSTYTDAGWDFVGETLNGSEDIWQIDEQKDYPRLSWE